MHGLVGHSGNSHVDFGQFFNGKLFSWAEFFLFRFGLFLQLSREGSENGVLALFSAVGLFVDVSNVVVSKLVDKELGGVGVVGEQFVVSVKLIGHSALSTMLDELNGGLAGEGDLENVSEFHDEELLCSGVTVQVLFADSGVVSVGLDHSEV